MYTKTLSRQNMKEATGARTPTATHSGGKNYSANKVMMSSLKTDGSARNKIGAGSENKNYSNTPPSMPMGKDVGNTNRVDSFHGGN